MFIHLLRCVVTTFVRGGALSRVAAPLCLGCRAIGNEEEEEEKKREEEAARSSNRGARACVCVDGRGHHRRRPTHTFPILYTNDTKALFETLVRVLCLETDDRGETPPPPSWVATTSSRSTRRYDDETTFFFSSSCVGADRLPLFFFSPKRKGGETQTFFFSTRDYRFQKEGE